MPQSRKSEAVFISSIVTFVDQTAGQIGNGKASEGLLKILITREFERNKVRSF